MEENEVVESGAESSAGLESQSDVPESTPSTEPTAQAAAPKPEETPIDWEKAFQHPRFKELVNDRNSEREKSRSLELKLAQLEGRLQQPTQSEKQERDELLEDLKKVDPRLAARFEALANTSKTVQQLVQKIESLENGSKQRDQQAVVKESVAKINQWHEANKVSPAIRQAVNAQLDVLYMQGKLNPQNLEQAYKAAYEPYKAYAEEIKRETLKGYVPSKQADAKVPASQPKGTAPKAPSKETPKFKDKEERNAHIAKEFLQEVRARREASSV